MKLKNFKNGSYNDEHLQNILKLFLKLESLNMFDYEMLSELKKICMNAVQRQIKELVKDMPFNARYTFTGENHSNHWKGIFEDRNLKLDTSIFYSQKLTFECENILKVENDEKHRFNVDCIISTQTQLKNIVDELLNVINEE